MNTITEKLMFDTLDCFVCMYLSTVDYPFDTTNIKNAKSFAKTHFRKLCDELEISMVEVED